MSALNFAVADVLGVYSDEHGLSAKVRVTFKGLSVTIRWGLDDFTYQNLSECMRSHAFRVNRSASTTGFPGTPGGDVLRIGLPRVSESEACLIPGFFLSDLRETSFECSAMFASNMNWLTCIQSIDELTDIQWTDTGISAAEEPLSEEPPSEEPLFDEPRMSSALDVLSPQAEVEATQDNEPEVVDGVDNTAIADDAADGDATAVDTPVPDSAVSMPRKARKRSAGDHRGNIQRYGTIVASLILVTTAYASVPGFTTHISAENLRTPTSRALPVSSGQSTTVSSTNQASPATGTSRNVTPVGQQSETNAVAKSASPTGTDAAAGSSASAQTTKAATSPGNGDPSGSGSSNQTGTAATNRSAERPTQVFEVPKGEVALTFDDGPTPLTDKFVKVLQQYGVHATFFFVGKQVHYWPDSVKRAAAAGEVIGDHSMTHPNLKTLSASKQASQIVDDQHLLEKLTGESVTMFRPPYGSFNSVTGKILVQNGMSLALWNRDPRDWAAKNPEQVVQAVLGDNPSGGVFDMHEKDMTLAALPAIIKGLQARHLKIVTLPAPKSTL